jgi:hypothetical protein
MRLVCVTREWWSKYCEALFHRGAPEPWPTKTMLLVAEGSELVAGVCIYDTTGPHVFFEHLVTNETATGRMRSQAVKMMAKEMVSYARTVGKIPHVLVHHKGIERILKSVGLVPSGAWSMTCPLSLLEGKDESQVPGKYSHGVTDSEAPGEALGGDATQHPGVRPSVAGGGGDGPS